MFHDARSFAFLQALTQRWQDIRAELDAVSVSLMSWPQQELHDGGWRVYGLYAFPDGEPIVDHVAACPLTAALIAEHVPHHGSAGFSVLSPHAHVSAHEGRQSRFLRAHLGLRVPEGDCALRVQLSTRQWEEGKWLVFDDRFEHEAWNRTELSRAVLLLDFNVDRRERFYPANA